MAVQVGLKRVWLCLHPVARTTDGELASLRYSALYAEMSPREDVAEGKPPLKPS